MKTGGPPAQPPELSAGAFEGSGLVDRVAIELGYLIGANDQHSGKLARRGLGLQPGETLGRGGATFAGPGRLIHVG